MKAEGRRQKVEGRGGKLHPDHVSPFTPFSSSRSLIFFLQRFSAVLRVSFPKRHVPRPSAFCLLPSAFCLLPSAFCLLPSPGHAAESLTLADCLKETALNSPAIVEQQFAIQGAYGQRLALRATALPTLGTVVDAGYQGAQTSETLQSTGVGANGKPLPDTTSPRNSTAILLATGQLTQPIFDAAIPASWRLGTLGITAARQAFYTVATAELFRAHQLFIRTLYAQKREEVLRLTDRTLQTNLAARNALLDSGLGSRQDVLSAQVQRANFDPQVISNTGSFHANLATLLQVMGRRLPEARGKADPLDGITLAGNLDDGPLDFDPAAAARAALATRPDLQALRTEVKTFTENANVARAGYYPSVRIYLAGQYLPQTYVASASTSSRVNDRVETTELRPGIRGEWTVIDTGTIRGQTQQFDALRAAVGNQLHNLELTIPGDLATVRAQADAARASMEELQSNVAISQDTLNIIQAGVAQGLNSQLEFLDAQNGVFDTRLGLLEAQETLGLAHAEFDRITGRYVRYVPDTHPASHPATAKK